MSAIVNFAMFPLDRGASMAHYVACVVDALDRAGVQYSLGPMATTFEVPTIEEALHVIAVAHNALAAHSDRIYITMNIDSRNTPQQRSEHKVDHVRQILNDNNSSNV